MLACLHLRRDGASADLVALAQDFSPRFEVVSPDVVVVDVSGLDRLVGDADAVGMAIGRLARARRLPVTVTLAPTRTAAIILALADAAAVPADRRTDGPPFRCVRPGEVAAALALLPLSILSALLRVETAMHESSPAAPAGRVRPARRGRGSGRHYRLAPSPGASPMTDRHAPLGDLLQTLQRWGLRTLGAFAALPSIDLFERLGSSGAAWQAVARGEAVRPLVRTVPGDPFEATAALEWPVETLEPLSFVLAGLLDPLCARLERAERGVAVLQTTLQLVTRTLHLRTLELPAPMRDARVLRTLILLDLESHPPAAGIDRVTIAIEPAPGRVVQHSLLERARPSPEHIATLAARLTAIFGESRVGAPALVDSYAPGAFALRPFDGDAAATVAPASSAAASAGGTSPVDEAPDRRTGFVLRRFRRPILVQVERTRGRPVRLAVASDTLRGGSIVQAAGPWRTSGAWWTGVEGGSRTSEVGSRKLVVDSRKLGGGSGKEAREAGSPAPVGLGAAPGVIDAPWDRDEWDVVVAGGTALRLSCDRATKQWFVEGVLD